MGSRRRCIVVVDGGEFDVEVGVGVERALWRAVRMGLKGEDDRCRG